MTGENIVCLAKDWNENPTSNNHVMIELARNNRVLWINSIATRRPKFSSGRDLKKIFQKLASFFRGVQEVRPNLWMYTPIVLPFPHSRVARVLNRWILKASIGRLRRTLGMKEFQLWTFLPSSANYVGELGETISVYYCTDEWSNFSYLKGDKIADADQRLCRKADVVFATAQTLVDRRLAWNPNTYLARHGVDHELFSAALKDELKVPDDLAAVPKPVLGFYGTIQDWVDLDLLEHLAKRHPEWSIVLIGPEFVDVSKLKQYPNVHFLGRKQHASLPAYCKGFSIGLLPQKVIPLTMHMNPIKLREYLSAGLPVVATALPEVACYSQYCSIANDYQQFEQAIIDCLREDTPELRRRRSEAMIGETWRQKVKQVTSHVMRIKAERCKNQAGSIVRD